MTELHWSPDQIGRLTIHQLLCLLSERPPGQRKVTTAEEYQAEAGRLTDGW